MRYVTLPGTTLTVSALGLGSNRFGSVIARDDAFRLLDAFVERGGTLIDTAHIYADWIPDAPRSASEKTIGAWLRQRGGRERLVLATKGGHPRLDTPHVSRLSLADLRADIQASLEFLHTDRIDLYWLHRDDPAIPVGEIVDAVHELVQSGYARYVGCSNWRAARLRAALDDAQRRGVTPFVANQPQWSLAVPNRAALSDPERLVVFGPEDERLHRDTGLAVMAYSAQAQGFFDKLARLGAAGLSERDRQAYVNPTNLALFRQVEALAKRHATSVTAIALSYLLGQPFPTIPILGPRTAAQLQASAAALDVTLSSAEMGELAALRRGAEGTSPR